MDVSWWCQGDGSSVSDGVTGHKDIFHLKNCKYLVFAERGTTTVQQTLSKE